MVRLGRSSASQCEFTNAYQPWRPNQNPSDLACGIPYQSLPDPVPTERIALVVLDWSTNCYQPADLALSLPCECFTNHYHRGLGQGIDVSVAGSVVAGMAVW